MRMTVGQSRRCWWWCCALIFASVAPASAHHRALGGSTAGLSIPSISHAQMAILDANRGAILAVAGRQARADSVAQRLETYVNLQVFACAWGLVPGSLQDEASPFNECTHAYLAGTQALLKRLRLAYATDAEVQALGRKVELEMLEGRAASVLCQFSGEPFNTAEVVAPSWHGLPVDPLSSLTAILSLLAATAGLTLAASRRSSATQSGVSIGRLARCLVGGQLRSATAAGLLGPLRAKRREIRRTMPPAGQSAASPGN